MLVIKKEKIISPKAKGRIFDVLMIRAKPFLIIKHRLN
jgi:hypothetical protein